MYTIRGNQLFVSVLILLAVISTPMSYAHLAMEIFQNGAPFSIDVEPEKVTAEPGDEIIFNIRIEAEEGFTASIEIELEISVLVFSVTLDLGTVDPPYPKEIKVTVNIPSDIPDGDAQGILRGIGGEHTVEENVEITIQGETELSKKHSKNMSERMESAFQAFKTAFDQFMDQLRRIMRTIARMLGLLSRDLGAS